MSPGDNTQSMWRAESYAEFLDHEDGQWKGESEYLLVVATNEVDAMGYLRKWEDDFRSLVAKVGDQPSRNWTIRNFERVEDTDCLITLVNQQPGFTYSTEPANECMVTLIARSR